MKQTEYKDMDIEKNTFYEKFLPKIKDETHNFKSPIKIFPSKENFFIRILQYQKKICVTILDKTTKELLGTGKSSNKNEQHRYLKILSEKNKKNVGKKIIAILDSIEGKLKEENVSGYDLICFYIELGYVPVERDLGMNTLREELKLYLMFREEFERESLPVTKLKYNPTAAKKYWDSLQSPPENIEPF